MSTTTSSVNDSGESSRTESYQRNFRHPQLTRSNYGVWAIKMKMFISMQNACDAIEPSDPTRVVDAGKEQRALSAIYQALPDEVTYMIAEKTTTKGVWDILKTMYLGADCVKEGKLQTLKSEFELLHIKDADSIDDFTMKRALEGMPRWGNEIVTSRFSKSVNQG